MSRFVEFEQINDTNIGVQNKKTKERLGLIEYNAKWRKFVFCPEEMTFYDTECLSDIAEELKKRDENRKGSDTK